MPKKHTISWAQKKVTQPLGPKKIMQSWAKKNHAISRTNKKSPNLSGLKKIMLPLGSEIIPQPLVPIKNIQPLVPKKSRNLRPKKNHGTLGQKKSRNLSCPKKNHAASLAPQKSHETYWRGVL